MRFQFLDVKREGAIAYPSLDPRQADALRGYARDVASLELTAIARS